MAPSQTPKIKSPSSTPMKQAKLSFKATKRTSSKSSPTTTGKTKKTKKAPAVQAVIEDRIGSSSGSSEDEMDFAPVTVGTKRKIKAEKVALIDVEEFREDLGALEKSARLRKHWKWVQQRRGEPVVHAQDETKAHHILRVFDNTYDYGPCVGVTRLERWERAKALNLNPPEEVRVILLSKQGTEEDVYKHPVFYGEV